MVMKRVFWTVSVGWVINGLIAFARGLSRRGLCFVTEIFSLAWIMLIIPPSGLNSPKNEAYVFLPRSHLSLQQIHENLLSDLEHYRLADHGGQSYRLAICTWHIYSSQACRYLCRDMAGKIIIVICLNVSKPYSPGFNTTNLAFVRKVSFLYEVYYSVAVTLKHFVLKRERLD